MWLFKVLWAKLRKIGRKGDSVRYLYAPSRQLMKYTDQVDYCNRRSLYSDSFRNMQWQPARFGPIGKWIIDKRGYVQEEILNKMNFYEQNYKEMENVTPFKPRIKKERVRETVKKTIEELKKSNG